MMLRARPWSGVAALGGLLARSGALRHPGLARAAAREGLPGVIRLAAARRPERVALVRGGDAITAGDLHDEVLARAGSLPGSGTVGVRSDGGIGFVVTLAAALAAGADAVPLGPRMSAADVAELGLDDILEPTRGPQSPTRPAARVRLPLTQHPVPGRLLLLTTGTTGTPVATTRGRLGLRALAQLADADRRSALPSDRPLLLLAPPDHGHGLSALAGALLRGIPVVLASGLTPDAHRALVETHAPVSISGVPAQLARLLDAGGIGDARVVVAGSSPLSPGLRRRLEASGARVHDGFGATATGTVAVDGRPLAGVRLRVRDGELEVRAPLGGDRWVATGDRVVLEAGTLRPAGRTGALVDSGGELVDPARLRDLLADHPGVRGCAVEVVPDDLLGAVLHARVDAEPAIEAELRATIAARLGRAEHPRRLEFGAV